MTTVPGGAGDDQARVDLRVSTPPATVKPNFVDLIAGSRDAPDPAPDPGAPHPSLAFHLMREPGVEPPRRVARTAWACVALFAVAFLVVARGVRECVPWPSDLGMDVRFQAFAQHKDEYQAVYVGPSSVFRSFRPEIIDPVVSQAGKPFRSFNLGVGGMSGFEQNFYIREILAMEPRSLEWVIAEPSRFRLDATMYNLFSERELYYHDLETTLEVLRAILLAAPTWSQRVDLWVGHVQAWSWRLTNLGIGPRIVEALLRRHVAADEIETWQLVSEGGFQGEDNVFSNRHNGAPLGYVQPPMDAREYQARLELVDLGIAAIDKDKPYGLARYDVTSFRKQRQAVEASGRELIYVLPPVITLLPEMYALEAQGDLGTFLDFHGPARWPQLYRIEERIDPQHLNRAGAGTFSTVLAGRLGLLWGSRHGGAR